MLKVGFKIYLETGFSRDLIYRDLVGEKNRIGSEEWGLRVIVLKFPGSVILDDARNHLGLGSLK